MGQSLLTPEFNRAKAVARLRSRPELEIGVALMNQSLLAGIGNVFKSEICFTCSVHPFRLVRSLSEAELAVLVATGHKLLQANVIDLVEDSLVTHRGFRRTTGRLNSDERLWVYDRAGQPCRRCSTAIESYRQGLDARTTFWCPRCQPGQVIATSAR